MCPENKSKVNTILLLFGTNSNVHYICTTLGKLNAKCLSQIILRREVTSTLNIATPTAITFRSLQVYWSTYSFTCVERFFSFEMSCLFGRTPSRRPAFFILNNTKVTHLLPYYVKEGQKCYDMSSGSGKLKHIWARSRNKPHCKKAS